ncbi:hypothetical protein QYE76_041383 [Lolium multiflorum]|uniref:F-box domain-containing protein n=1 Tax=Lolium multiflorum TaxID=4521 RepID=A0AAD8WTY2_LOLMU|nr:hypothetical protein QYE76_041383 [Lolium multiflorum]
MSSPADDDDLLREILIRLPTQPSSLLRASLVCKRWLGLVKNPRFLRRFRTHHGKPPLLGFFFKDYEDTFPFVPSLKPPDRISAERFTSPFQQGDHDFDLLDCRHGLVLLVNRESLQFLIWDPVTGVIMEEDEEGDDIDESYLDHFGDTFMDDAEGGEGEGEGDQEEARDEPVDDLGRTIADARSRCETEKERENLDHMLEDHRKALYPGCDDGLKKLGCTLDLLKWKAQAGVADSAFENLLKMLKNMFPKNNELPASTYEAKKVVCPLGLEVLKIHACINDCILYRGEYENLNECPVCTALRYKIRGDDPGDDVEGQKPRKKVPAKVMWYAPIIPRLKRLFRNKEHAKLLRWHKEDHQLYMLAKTPSSTITTFQGYEINGNTFYTIAQDKKSTNQNSGVRFDAATENGQKVTYYGYIEEIWKLDYGPSFKVPLFRCKWFKLTGGGVKVDQQYGMTMVDFNNLGYLDEPFVLAKDVAQGGSYKYSARRLGGSSSSRASTKPLPADRRRRSSRRRRRARAADRAPPVFDRRRRTRRSRLPPARSPPFAPRAPRVLRRARPTRDALPPYSAPAGAVPRLRGEASGA